MAFNQRASSPGTPRRFTGEGELIGPYRPGPAETGAHWQDAARMFAGLAGALGDIADQAAQREGAVAGLAAGAAAALPESGSGLRAAPIDRALVDRIVAVESGGNARAANPNSSALGAGQFIASTWLGLVARYRPDLVTDRSKAEVLALRTDPALSREMTARYTAENATVLEAAGISTTAGNLYLAHFLGPAGARDLLSAERDASAAAVNPQAARSNRSIFYAKDGRARTVAEIMAWSARKMGDAPGGAPNVADPAAASAPGVPVVPDRPPAATPALRRDGTLYGEAYDEAAIRAHGWRLEAALHAELGSAWQTLQDDPRALDARFAEIRKTYIEDSGAAADPRMREMLERSFAEKALTYGQAAAARTLERRRGEARAAAADLSEQQRIDIERQAMIAGGTAGGDAAVAGLIDRAGRKIDAMVAAGDLDPVAGAKEKRALAEAAAAARIRGAFAALPDLASRETFAGALLEQWKRGDGTIAALDFRQVDAISGELTARVREERDGKSAEMARRKVELGRLVEDDVASIRTTGIGVTSDEKPLDAAEIGALLGPAAADAWMTSRTEARRLHEATSGFVRQTPAQIDAAIAALQPKPGEAGFDARQKTFEQAAVSARAVIEARRKDPAAAADTAFPNVADLAQGFGAEPTAEALATLLRARDAAQTALGIPREARRPLRDDEVTAIRQAMETSPGEAAGWATTIAKAMGEDAGRVLGQLSDQAPALAVAAQIGIAGGGFEALTRLTQQQATMRDPAYKKPARKDTAEANLAREAFGRSLLLFPEQELARTQLAGVIFEGLARERGVPPDAATPAGAAVFREAAAIAAGARFVDGEQFGGITTVNGIETLAPPSMPAERLEALISEITDEDLARLPPIGSANGVPVTAREIARGHLVAVGDGVYRIALGDPAGFDPRYVATPDGQFWMLDLKRLEAMMLERPPARRGMLWPRG